MIVESIVLIALGALLTVIGIINCTGNINSIHSYNRRRITEQTRVPYGKAVGSGTAIIGVTMTVAAVLDIMIKNPLIYLVIIPGIIVGITLILYGQFKYNKGIF